MKIKLNHFYCEDCIDTMENMVNEKFNVDYIITSPPYNTTASGKSLQSKRAREQFIGRYDVFDENMSNEEYLEWMLKIFSYFDKVLKKNGCILWVMNYGNSNPTLIWDFMYTIIHKSNFTFADELIWKKKRAIPNVSAFNKLTRRCEHVFVFCRKEEYMTFEMNKKVTAIRKDGRKYYNHIDNFIETYNNDFSKDRFYENGATFSTELICTLIDKYVPERIRDNCVIYDPFMGSGTTANACKMKRLNYIGSEISSLQCDYAKERVSETQLKLI